MTTARSQWRKRFEALERLLFWIAGDQSETGAGTGVKGPSTNDRVQFAYRTMPA